MHTNDMDYQSAITMIQELFIPLSQGTFAIAIGTMEVGSLLTRYELCVCEL